MSASVADRSVVVMAQMLFAGNPALSTASANTRAIVSFEWAAKLPPRNTQALPDFTQMPAASAVTFGRASYTMATTPSGTLMRESSMPLYIVRSICTHPSGSGRSRSSSSAVAIASTRASSSIKRSRMESFVPASRAAAMSSALASTMAGVCSRSAAAIASSAPLRASALAAPKGPLASRARSANARTSS